MYELLKYLTDVPFNFWFYLLLITSPLLVLSVNPSKTFWWRLGRIILAVGLTYVLINLSLHTGRTLDRKDYVECQKNSQFREMSIEMQEECGHHINIADGASNVFYLYFGWIPAAGYVGFWELIWRIRHKKVIKNLGKNYNGRWFSNIVIAFFIIFFIFVFCLIVKMLFKFHIYPLFT